MKKWLLPALAVVVFIVAAPVVMRMMVPPPDDLDLARSKPTERAVYAVRIEPETEPLQQGALHSWIATVSLPGGAPVEDATVAIDGGMPQHGHGLPTAPQATDYLGDGRYLIEGVRFNMGGWWEFRLDISSPEGDDFVVFNIVL